MDILYPTFLIAHERIFENWYLTEVRGSARARAIRGMCVVQYPSELREALRVRRYDVLVYHTGFIPECEIRTVRDLQSYEYFPEVFVVTSTRVQSMPISFGSLSPHFVHDIEGIFAEPISLEESHHRLCRLLHDEFILEA